MTPDEASSTYDIACQPLANRLLNCTSLLAPPAPQGNDSSIRPLPAIEYSGPTFSAVSINRPNPPVFDPIPSQIDQDWLDINWDLGYGVPILYWEVWDNGIIRYRGRQFTQRPITVPSPLSAPSSPTYGAKNLAIQSGYYRLDMLEHGRHELEFNLCNLSPQNEPLCVTQTATVWVGSEGGSPESSSPQASAKPGKPQINWIPSANSGEPVNVSWQLWWGKPGSYWQVFSDDDLLFESRKFEAQSENAQSSSMQLVALSTGTHALRVELCNVLDCTSSDPITVTVLAPPTSPPAVQLQLHTTPDNQWLVSWSMPVGASPQAPDKWQLQDVVSGLILLEMPSVGLCKARVGESTPDALTSYCGEALQPMDPALQTVRVRICTREDCIDSASLKLE